LTHHGAASYAGAVTQASIRTTLVLAASLAGFTAGCGADGGRVSDTADGGARADGRSGDSADGAPGVASMFVHTADVLYTVASPDFDLVEIGPFGLAGNEAMNDLAVTPAGDLYGITGSKLYRIDAATGAATFAAEVDGTDNVAMTFLPDGSLLAADKPGAVRTIQPDTGTVAELGTYGDGYGTAGDLVAVADGTMFAIADQGPNGDHLENNLLLTIDPTTGSYLSLIGEIGFGHVFGVAYAGGKVYAFTRDGEIIEIDRTTGDGTLVRTHTDTLGAPLGFYGAGVTPLVQVE
jgi:hypothetical protein